MKIQSFPFVGIENLVSLYKAVTETLISFTLFKKSISSNLYRFSYEDWEVIFFGDILISILPWPVYFKVLIKLESSAVRLILESLENIASHFRS
jgi:hypothetical protein